MKRALITGIGGQDGSYLAEYLLELGYEVHGIVRRSATGNLRNLTHCLDRITLHQGDVTDYTSLQSVMEGYDFDEVYHEADQDNVDYSLQVPGQSVDVTIKGTMNLLEIAKRMECSTKIFIPCSATMFASSHCPLYEGSSINPQSPYAIGKVAAYHLARYYRETHKMFVSTAILFNHDSVRRYGNYLLHKICKAAVRCSQDQTYRPSFNNIDQEVTVGWAPEFVTAIHKILQVGYPCDYVIGSDVTYPLSTLLHRAFRFVGLDWKECVDVTDIPNRITSNVRLIPDYSKAQCELDWKPQKSAPDVIFILMNHYLGDKT